MAEASRNLYLSQKLGSNILSDIKPSFSQVMSLIDNIISDDNFKSIPEEQVRNKINDFNIKQYRYFYSMLFKRDYNKCKELLN